MNAVHGLPFIGLVSLGAGLVACATPAQAQMLQSQRSAYGVEVLVDGVPAPTYQHRGQTYLLGHMGQRYVIRVSNHTGRRVEAVVSVDGRDAIDGRTADFQRKRGYLVPAWGSVEIDGWRLSDRKAAAFRFSSVAASYAGRMGAPRHVGVIGVAVFPERAPVAVIPYWRRHSRARDAGEAAPPSAPARPSSPPAADAAAGRGAESAPGVAEAPRATRRPGPSDDRSRPGLGTEFGEATHSPIQEVHFVRAHATQPAVILGLRYNDRRGLLALGIDVDGYGRYHGRDQYLRGTADPFPASHRGGPYAAPPPGWRGGW